MTFLRSCMRFVGAFALVVPFAGCDSGGPEPFAPGTAPAVAPASSSAHEPLGPASPGAASQKRYKKGTLPTQGPQEHP
jgi:hypothetical protein